MFKPDAGQMRGFRIVRDPDGILLNSFEYMGTQMGYVIIYGEGIPAIHNGEEWVPVVTDEVAATFEDNVQSLIMDQGAKIAAAVQNPVYAELATQMGMYAGAPAGAASADPAASAPTFGG